MGGSSETRRSAPGRPSSGKSSKSSSSKAAAASETVSKLKDGAVKASEVVKKGASKASGAVDDIVESMGGYNGLDKTIKTYNRSLYDFANKTYLQKIPLTNRPSKFVFFLVFIAIFQAVLPVFGYLVDICARMLGFLFLYNTGLEELRAGFRSARHGAKVRSLLVVFLLSSAFQIVPTFLFDTYYHFGALWTLLLPILLFITPNSKEPDSTIGSIVADTVFAGLGDLLDSIIPGGIFGDGGETTALIVAGAISLLFWVGYLGSSGSYVTVWIILAVQTIQCVGSEAGNPETDGRGYVMRMTGWHNILAIWLWRYLISAIEGISIPGIVSILSLIIYYVPSYFLWITAFMVAMLVTKKTEKSKRADTWYARWLISDFGTAVGAKSRSSSSSDRPSSNSSGSSRSGQESKRSRTSGASRSREK